MNEDTLRQVPKELEERLEQIRELIRTDTEEYARVPSMRDIAGEFNLSIEEVAEGILYLPVDEFCDYISFMSQYEWEIVSHMSEMKSKESGTDEIEEDDEDYSMLESFHFMT